MAAATALLLDGNQLFAQLQAALWVSLRVGAAVMASPLIGARLLPLRARLIVTLALAALLAPLQGPLPVMAVDALTVLNVARELALGVAIGFLLRLAFEAGAVAGELVAQGMGLSFAQMADPVRGGMAAGLVGQWFYIVFALLFFACDGHLALIELLARSYQQAPIGTPLAAATALAAAPPQFFLTVLAAGVHLALPLMLTLLVVNLGFGVLSRAAPALNPIQIGLPAALFLGLALLGVLTGQLLAPVRELLHLTFGAAGDMLGRR